MNRIYISGSITDGGSITDRAEIAEREQAFHDAEIALRALGFKPINPARTEGREFCTSWLDYMRAALRDIAEADAVAVLPGWDRSRGAQVEVRLAGDLGLPHKPLAEWLAE